MGSITGNDPDDRPARHCRGTGRVPESGARRTICSPSCSGAGHRPAGKGLVPDLPGPLSQGDRFRRSPVGKTVEGTVPRISADADRLGIPCRRGLLEISGLDRTAHSAPTGGRADPTSGIRFPWRNRPHQAGSHVQERGCRRGEGTDTPTAATATRRTTRLHDRGLLGRNGPHQG